MADHSLGIYAETATHTLEHLTGKQWMIVDKVTGKCRIIRYEVLKSSVKEDVKRFGERDVIDVYSKLTFDKVESMYKPNYRMGNCQ